MRCLGIPGKRFEGVVGEVRLRVEPCRFAQDDERFVWAVCAGQLVDALPESWCVTITT